MALAVTKPWAFTQQPPMTTSEFCEAAARRGLSLDNWTLRELWRVGAIAPLVEVRNRIAGAPCPSPIPEPVQINTWPLRLRLARDSGRLIDPEELGFRSQLPFDRPKNAGPLWWNGLFYSRWQLLAVARFADMLRVASVRRSHGVPARFPPLTDHDREQAQAIRRLAQLLVALEARYFPEIKRPWVHLTNATVAEWYAYREQFAPTALLGELGWSAEGVARAADELLLGLRGRDPLKEEWTHLVRRASYGAWDRLEGQVLVALDSRIAAEMLILCYEDMAERSHVSPLADRREWFSSDHERLSHTDTSLDGTLSALGLSPHPRVVLVIEGETEELLMPLVRDFLRLTDEHGIVRSVVMRGTKAGLLKLVAFAAGPLIERGEGENWLLVKPPTSVVVAVDPDPPFDTDDNIKAQQAKMIDEIVAVIRAQGIEPDRSDLEDLVRIESWTQSCFEFSHFDDEEIATAIASVHPDCNGLSHERLVAALRRVRDHRCDIKTVWSNWRSKPSKTALARALWPYLQEKIMRAEAYPDVPVPEVVVRLEEAHRQATARPAGRWILKGVAIRR